jgi:hypothetical protein
MRTGALISGAAHAALIAAAIWGLPWLSPRAREPIAVTSVSFVSDAAFEAAQEAAAAAPAPQERPTGAVTLPPEIAEEPEVPMVEPPAAPQEDVTEMASVAPQSQPQAPLRAPDGSLEPFSVARRTPEPPATVMAPRARPAIRIEPDATPPAPEESRPAEVARAETAPQPEAEAEVEELPAQAPEEAAPEPVAEPAPQVELALQSSGRPVSRPQRQAAAQVEAPEPEPTRPEPVADTPADTSADTPADTPADAPADTPSGRQSQISDLVASAAQPQASAASSGPGQASGPPLSSGEKDGLRLAVQACWNVPAGLRDAQELRVVVGAELTATGDVVSSSIRLIDPDPVPDTRFQRVFDAGRRALIRCSPYNSLPRDKYAQWRTIEVVFNPEGMVSW